MKKLSIKKLTPAIALTTFAVSTFIFAASSPAGSASQPATTQSAHSDKPDVVDIAIGNEDFSTLVAAVKAAGLVETLKGDGPFTIMAPNNAAFAKLPEGTVATLLKPENKDKLTAVLTYHVVSGNVMAKDALKAGKAHTLQGGKIKFTSDDKGAYVNGIKILATDIVGSNGVIHVIDEVLLPAAK